MVIVAGRDAVVISDGVSILTAIDEQEAATLSELALGREVLEVGSAYGFSSITMALGGATSILTVDPHAGECVNSGQRLRENIDAYDVARIVKPMVGRSEEILPALVAKRRRFDLVFIDGDHSVEVVRQDAENGWKLLRPDGVFVCHDYDTEGCPGVRHALDELWPDGADETVGSLWIKHKGKWTA